MRKLDKTETLVTIGDMNLGNHINFLILFFFFTFFLSSLLQCKFANSTLLSLLRYSNFITLYDAQASSAFSALIFNNVLCFTRVKLIQLLKVSNYFYSELPFFLMNQKYVGEHGLCACTAQ